MLDTPIQEFVFYDKYSRFNHELGRRETWDETVDRVVDFLRWLSREKLSEDDYERIDHGIRSGLVSPSMRLMATAGDAAKRNPLLLYNCAYTPVTSIRVFPEILWLSMSGIGVGYSVEKKYVELLPRVEDQVPGMGFEHVIDDSAEGWVIAYAIAVQTWWNGGNVRFDYSRIRAQGEPLKTKGGTASGPGVLIDLMNRTKKAIFAARGRKLRPVEVFDIVTTIGNCAVSGGVRRSAQLTMFSHDDHEMLSAKSNGFWETHPYRSNANISAVWERRMSMEEISQQMYTMFENKTGEPGVVSRAAMISTQPQRRRTLVHGGLNPCAEVNLHGSTADGRFGGQLCNLSSVNLRPDMDEREIAKAARVATIIGTIQAMATNFTLLRDEWREICEEERILGVSLVGFSDNKHARDPEVMARVRDSVVATNARYARLLGINQAAAATCVKPAGNSSVMYNVSRGMNPRYAPFYIRRVRVGANTPVYRVLDASGVPMSPENGQEEMENPSTYVASFHVASPAGALTVGDFDALTQLDFWRRVKLNWTEHNPSVTIEYSESERSMIAAWLWENQDIVNGVSFLPRTDVVYNQPPYEEITEAEYAAAIQPHVDWSLLKVFEKSDSTSFELECAGGVCDLR